MDSAAATTPAAGWFADPHLPNALRWWDGSQWTQHVHQAAPAAPAHQAGGAQGHAPAAQQSTAPQTAAAAAGRTYASHGAYAAQPASASVVAQTSAVTPSASAPSLMEANPKSMIAIIVSALYLALAITTGVVLAGVVPAVFTFRAFEGREKLAPVALLAAAGAIGFAFTHMHAQ